MQVLAYSKGCNFKLFLKTYKTFAPCTLHLKPPCTGRQSCSCPARLRVGPAAAGAPPPPAPPAAAPAWGSRGSRPPMRNVHSPAAPVPDESGRQQVLPVQLHPQHLQQIREVPALFSLTAEQNKKGFQKEKHCQWLFAVSQEQLLPEGHIQLAQSPQLDKRVERRQRPGLLKPKPEGQCPRESPTAAGRSPDPSGEGHPKGTAATRFVGAGPPVTGGTSS